MELVNQTPLAASVEVAETPTPPLRMGFVVAKATYGFDASGNVKLDGEDPYPIFYDDMETRLGLLPRDTLPRADEAFEVICLGAAHAPGGRAVEQMTVRLRVGEAQRMLRVSGDRRWQGPEDAKEVTAPLPFVRMPLAWSRSYGGSAAVAVDPNTIIDVAHPLNPAGRGFNPYPAARSAGKMLASPEGYPQVLQPRLLPNVEDPASAVVRWEDDPEPAGWTTVPLTSGMQAMRSLELRPETSMDQEQQQSVLAGAEDLMASCLETGIFHRAAPCWVLDLPAKGAAVVMEGLTPERRCAFFLPEIEVLADYVVGERQGTCQLRPQVLVLLPEERRFYLVLRHCFSMDFRPGEERCIRLRQATGWQGGKR